ncbi:uncharacterized protein [Medicago truncatula]|uniref:MtN22 protein n=1 Tax=Medicago truncatula TaxID=3880 RepID=O24092_MEDTR|nr:uncharacterized protein LOC11443541 isoform X2 [Medicago truncatula]AES70455.1 NMS32/34 protein, putative [Medicago truncatula]CAA75576.1 MtN22 [Medicago truncatula]
MANSKVYVFVGLFVVLSYQVLAQSPLPPPPILDDPRPNGPKEIPFEALETVEAVNEMIHHDKNSGKMHKVMIPACDWMTFRGNLIKKKCAETIPNSRKFLKHLCDEGNKFSEIDEEDNVSLSDREYKASKSGEEDGVSKSNEEDKVSKNDEGDQVSKIDGEDAVSKNDKEDNVFMSNMEDNVFKSDEEDKISLTK